MPTSNPLSAITTLAILATALVSDATAQMGKSVDFLSFRVTDAEYSRQLAKIIAVSDSPTDSLHVYDPVAKSGASVRLPLAGTCVSVSPDGTQAVVGHSGWITHVDLKTVAVIDSIQVSADANDVVLGGNGWAYVFPTTGQWVRIHCIELATKKETQSTGSSVRHGTKAKLHPSGDAVYGADNGLSPSDIEKYDITAGTANYLYDSPYHGTYSMAGDLWIAEDGQRIFVRGGNVFRSSKVRASDMVYNGRLSNLNLVEWIDHSSAANKILAIPEKPSFGTGADDTELQVYDYSFLNHESTNPFPKTNVNGTLYVNHGRFVFFDAGGTRAWAVVQLDASSGALFDYGVVRFDLKPTKDPLTVDVETISISGGGTQTMSLDAGAQYANERYYVLGSLNGTTPGIPVDSVVVPLNFDVIYLWHTFNNPNQWPLGGSLGRLDGQGQATTKFSLTPRNLPVALSGLQLHHAFVVGRVDKIVFASNAVPLRLTN